MDEIIYVFIDAQNLYHNTQSRGFYIDYKKLYILLTRKYHAKKVFYFIGYVEKNKQLYKRLEKIGYILVFKPTFTIYKNNQKTVKGNVDGELILQTMIEINNYDKAIIVSGDGDYLCLVRYLGKIDKLGRIIVPNINAYSRLLSPYANKILDIELHRNDIEK